MLADLLRQGYRVHVIDQPTKLSGVKFAKGTFLLRTRENPETLHADIRRIAGLHRGGMRWGSCTDTAMVDEGAGLGGDHVSWVKPPKVAMLVDRPASPYAGHTWYLFDQVWQYPLTRVPAARSLTSIWRDKRFDFSRRPLSRGRWLCHSSRGSRTG